MRAELLCTFHFMLKKIHIPSPINPSTHCLVHQHLRAEGWRCLTTILTTEQLNPAIRNGFKGYCYCH